MRNRLLLVLIGIWGVVFSAYSQSIGVDSLCVMYRSGSSELDLSYMDNAEVLDQILSDVMRLQSENRLERVVIYSGSSPEGANKLNERLSQERADNLAAYIADRAGVPISHIEKRSQGVAWDMLRTMVVASDMQYRNEVLNILDNTPVFVYDANRKVVDSRLRQLMNLRGGQPWWYMMKEMYPLMRSSASVIVFANPDPVIVETPDSLNAAAMSQTKQQEAADSLTEALAQVKAVENADSTAAVTEEGQESPAEWQKQIAVKTNAVGIAMFMINAGVEFDINKLLSVNIPIYYSGFDYTKETLKFRIFGIQPELRFWPEKKHRFFAGIHLGVAYYNLALEGEYRIQDKNGKTPLWGGGINVGYRFPLSKKNERWQMELSVGGGVYDIRYDKFDNSGNGALVKASVHDTFFGVDNVAVSIVYMFDMKKKK